MANFLKNTSRMRPVWAFVATIMLMIFSCKSSLSPVVDDVDPTIRARIKSGIKNPKPAFKRVAVTWSYLREMSKNGQNPAIYAFLKEHDQLFPRKASGAKISGEDCNSYENNCEEDQFDDPIVQSWRVDLPLTVNGQTVWVSIVVNYNVNTGSAVSYGVALYGNNAPSWSTYVPTTTYYANNQSTILGSLYYNYTTQTTYQMNAGITGVGTLGGVGLEANVNGGSSQTYTITQSGTLQINASLNLMSGIGTGSVQINGPNGPIINYAIEPN